MTSKAVYTHGFHASVLRSHTWRTAENSAGYLLPHLTAGAAVLDIGCGPGTITADLAERVGSGRVTAADASEEVLAQARRTVADRGLANVDFAVADVHALDFPDGSFDVVHAHQVLQHVTDPVRALREMRRVCRPGGLVAARDSDYAAMTWYPQVPALDTWLDVTRAVSASNGGQPDAGRRLFSWALRAGFTEITPSASTWCFATPEDRAWWSGLWAERMTASAIARQAVADGRATEDDLRRIADGWQEWGAAEDGWFAVLNGEILCRA
ncbi:methyltransferase domain-containing protein [Peterkaempfera bronchialis]|uniref:Methyltransferase domain-containing protein n=1 Tax=Peterkaempfera bronchialis TaxID=2126346 RepID=A0A345ST73_9ACTN|nr:class I SAM-dependent methyltransferase [Peterkaempfera bronchialis]AXI76928.1 methyltransferase domain-containing protein [Peterkaempfera bronchialis]